MPLSWRIVVLLLLAPALLAGCAGPREATANPPTPAPDGGAPGVAPAGFVLEGPTLTPLDGMDRPLREDDGALVRYTLRQPASAEGPATALVSYLFNGNVTDVETVQLAPGQTKSWEREVPSVRGMGEVWVEVRAGSARGEARAGVLAWPRPGETLPMDPYFLVRVDNWTRDEVEGVTKVGVTLRRGSQPFHEFRLHLLCADGTGAPARGGTDRPDVQPQPSSVHAFESRFPLCPDASTTYGVEVKADAPDGKGVFGRVLFVPEGWAPPSSPSPS